MLFATLAVFVYRALMGEGMDRKKAAVLAVFASFFYGISDEIHQMYTQGREAKLRDVVVDGFGAGVSIYLIYKYLEKLPERIRKNLLQIGIK